MDPFARGLPPAFAPTVVRRELVTAPAAGADFTITVPGGRVWKLLALRAQFVTDATVATRGPVLRVDDGNGDMWHVEFVNGQAASIDRRYCWAIHQSSAIEATNPGNNYLGPAPGFLLLPGWRLEMSTVNIQATDQWSLITALIEEGPFDFSIPDRVGRLLQDEYLGS